MQEDEEEDVPGEADVPAGAGQAAGEALAAHKTDRSLTTPEQPSSAGKGKRSLSQLAKGAIFREVVLAKVREMKEQEKQKEFEKTATESSKK